MLDTAQGSAETPTESGKRQKPGPKVPGLPGTNLQGKGTIQQNNQIQEPESTIPDLQHFVRSEGSRLHTEAQRKVGGNEQIEVNSAGRLKSHYKEWSSLTNNRFILDCIRGYKLELKIEPYQSSFPSSPILRGSESVQDVKNFINDLLELNKTHFVL